MSLFEVSVGPKEADWIGTTNEAIQGAVDQVAAAGGGVVRILPGTYVMNDSLHLRSNVTVRGSGSDTVLWKPPSVRSNVLYSNGYGLYSVSVEEPDKFPIGCGVHITDDRAVGFYDTVATVTWKDGNELGLSRALNHDIGGLANGTVTSVYPIISGCAVESIIVESLVVDGNAASNAYLHGCRGGGIFLLRTDRLQIKNVRVRHFNGDGISFQQCVDTLIERCCCTGNTGSGLHPGSGSVGFAFRGTSCLDNGRDGIYYCLRVSYSLCEDCVIEGNGQDGLSIGHRDTDAVIRRNHIASNSRHGIYIREDQDGLSGQRTWVEANVFRDNCRLAGDGDICFASEVDDFHIVRNEFHPVGRGGSNKTAIQLQQAPKGMVIHDNLIENGELLNAVDPSVRERIQWRDCNSSNASGLHRIPLEAVRHLNKVTDRSLP